MLSFLQAVHLQHAMDLTISCGLLVERTVVSLTGSVSSCAWSMPVNVRNSSGFR